MCSFPFHHEVPYEVTKLVYGKSAWLYRFHVLFSLAEAIGIHNAIHTISWSSVAAFERSVVRLKPGSLDEEHIESGRLY